MNIRILKVDFSNIPIFGDGIVSIDLIAGTRVSKKDRTRLFNVFGNAYQHEAIAFVGKVASGKTTILRMLSFVMDMLNANPINSINDADLVKAIKPGVPAVIDTYFTLNDSVYKLFTEISKIDGRLVISDETLQEKSIRCVKYKKSLYDFEGITPLVHRTQYDDLVILEDGSIMAAIRNRCGTPVFFRSLLRHTRKCLLDDLTDDIPNELILFLDPSIEYLKTYRSFKGASLELKFKGCEEVIYLNYAERLNRYLSAGTIKGLHVFMKAIECFRSGGYLLVDDIEAHLNKEIVLTLIRLFMDGSVNASGAVLLFSTHYAELLDELEFDDSIYVVCNENGIGVGNTN